MRDPALAVVPGGVNPKSDMSSSSFNFVLINATRTFFDSGVDSVWTRRRLSSGLPVFSLIL